MNNNIAIVTGANNGIGFETTIGMAKAGYQVVMACRNAEKAEAAKTRILESVPDAKLDILILDLSLPESVRRFAKNFRSKYPKLDVLINNAGVLDYSGRKNLQGHELQLATNHFGHFLLTSMLLELMPDNSQSRVVSLSSIAHKSASIHFNDIHCEKANEKGAAYGQSKLACLMFGDELDRRLKKAGKKILSVSAHPGGSDSGLFDDMSRIQYHVLKLLGPFITHSNESAAKPSLHAALSQEVRGGEYYGPQGFMDLKGPVGIAVRSDYSRNREVAAKLWHVSVEYTNAQFPFDL